MPSRKVAQNMDPLAFLAGGGEMGERMRAFNWAANPLGPLQTWPQSLRSAVSILLPSKAQIVLFWGPKLITLYNDAYRPVLGGKHPHVLGLPVQQTWPELWDVGLRDMFNSVISTGEAFWASDRPFIMERYGFKEETYFDVSYDPVRDESGHVAGVFCIVSDTTGRVIGERRLRTLRELSARTTAEARSTEETCAVSAQVIDGNPHDIPFALVYLLEPSSRTARLACTSRLSAGSRLAPPVIRLGAEADGGWPLSRVMAAGAPEVVSDLPDRFGEAPGGVWPEAAHTAVVLPIRQAAQDAPAGFIVVGVSPRRPLDDAYRGFFDLLAGHFATAIGNARAYEEERRRAEALAEIDRAKTRFFTNISHEFRTPLTLMLGPVQDMLEKPDGEVLPENRRLLDVVHRHGRRMLKLVNTLLDFSRIEAGRIDAVYEQVDLQAATGELASMFRSAIEKAGLRFVVDLEPVVKPVYVDRDMWEKIVSNLLSNALKFTFEGRIDIRLREQDDSVRLTVRDTGVGIAAKDLPQVFERFHRVEGARRRSHEGTGIGLALVQELVKLHGGAVTVESAEGKGTTFTVTIPTGRGHLPADRIGTSHRLTATSIAPSLFIEEASSWLPRAVDATPRVEEGKEEHRTSGSKPFVLVADDNADVQDYVHRLLSPRYEVQTVADGDAALAAMRQNRPDLLLTDVMMPGLDGFALLAKVRADPRLRDVPVILLSARAGEEARIEGAKAGADDYIVKPFSGRELVARIDGHLRIAGLRRSAAAAIRDSEQVFRTLSSFAPVGIFQTDADGRCLFVNRYWRELTGLTFEEALGDGWARALHPDDRERIARLWYDAAKAGDDLSDEYRFQTPQGKVSWVQGNAVALRDTEGRITGYIGTVTDITQRKLAEEALRHSEERYRAIVEAQAEMVCRFRPDGTILFANAAYARLVGGTPEGLVGTNFWRFVAESDQPHVRAMLERLRPEAPERRIENEFVAEDGVHWTLWTNRGLAFDERGRATEVQSAGMDITDRKRAEEAVRQSEARFRALLEAVPTMVWVSAPDGNIVHLNQRWLEYTGQTPAEYEGRGWTSALHPDDLPGVLKKWERATSVGDVYEGECRYRRRDGQYRWHYYRGVPLRDHNGDITGWCGASLDIEDRKVAEEALRESEKRFRAMADAAPAMLYITDADGRSTFLSQGWYEYSGQEESQALGYGWLEAVHPDDREDARRTFVRALEKQEFFALDHRVRRADGKYRWVIDTGRPRFADDGTFLGYIGSVIDVHQRKEYQEQLKRALAESQRSMRLKDEFLSTLSHELRTPMTAILGWSQMLRRFGATDGASEELSEGLEVIERNARLQAKMIEDLLDMNRILSGKMRFEVQPVDLGAVLKGAVEAVRPAADAKQLRIQMIGEDCGQVIRGDPNRLQQVFYNLMGNAVKFTPRGGRVQIICQRVNSHIEIAVADTGIGIRAEFLPHLFERFRQQDSATTRTFGGLGLGLAISKHLIELHGGSIHATSGGEGKGATFTVRLPIAIMPPPRALGDGEELQQEDPSHWDEPDPFEAERKLAGLKALVVDNEEDARALIQRLLRAQGATVEAASSADEAMQKLRAFRPDVLLSDIGMPVTDGYGLIRQVRALPAAEGGSTPAIALTAFARTEDRARSLLAGFQMHLAKPIDPLELVASIIATTGARRGGK